MTRNDPKSIVLRFNECINNRDLTGLIELISEDHQFIDSDGNVHGGKEQMTNIWGTFFDQFPDYQNHFSTVESRENQVFVEGYTTCSVDELDGPALWTAKVKDGLVTEWRVYLDTAENRETLGLPKNTESE